MLNNPGFAPGTVASATPGSLGIQRELRTQHH